MHDDQEQTRRNSGVDPHRNVLDLLFIAVVAGIVAAAFVSATGYEFISARTPLVITVPLMILISVQFVRSKKAVPPDVIRPVLSSIVKGASKTFIRTIAFIGWMLLLLGLIVIVGHYAAIAIVMFLLLAVVSRENVLFSLLLTAGLTVAIFLLFELVFDIELHRGAISRIWAGGGDSGGYIG